MTEIIDPGEITALVPPLKIATKAREHIAPPIVERIIIGSARM
jgi:hypothetical protein